MVLLDKINNSGDLKKLNNEQLKLLSEEIREFLIDNVSETGGHLASNLGVVELTVALNKVFDFSKDRIIFDVGHQCYVHKILTGRKDSFSELRKLGGISGFPKVKESVYDSFDTGHSSNSISVALGMKRGFKAQGDNRNVIALIGDGSLGGGMVFEALNDLGNTKENVMIILNDNQMSISQNKASISKYLNKVRTGNSYIDAKFHIENIFSKTPKIRKFVKNSKNFVKRLFINSSIFEELGIKYYGPFDGHNIDELIEVFENSKQIKEPFIIHVKTVKGKGYPFAENVPEKFHGISPFDKQTGNIIGGAKEDYSYVFGKKLIKLAEQNEKIVAISAAMPSGTGLNEFKKRFWNRFYDVGIAEQHAVSMCGGLAATGLVPVFAVYSSFLQRGFDQIITDVCLMNLHVVFAIDRAGVVGQDGETHQGLFDIAYLSMIPNLTILAPCDYNELENMLDYAVNKINSPVAIRYPRGVQKTEISFSREFNELKAIVEKEGNDLTVVAEGSMVSDALEIAEILENNGISCEVVNVRVIKPLDMETILKSADKTKRVVTMENGMLSGGMGQRIANMLTDDVKVLTKGYDDKFLEHGKPDELKKLCKMDSKSISVEIKEVFGL
ncbi:MAG: 1-deoxy-D-xylulose-5-phosphate synthase [Clostridia bacterium]|nr:1-deoxy-D-xylulose-5-phosphate synthase [Clostridia bacterium]